jgi:(1->4)-alpha-D-glucan 1-alpha-D-glucosylmutase
MPTATYRVQFRSGMDFARTAGIAPYLAELGVSHLYASPILQAQHGSTHGYDVTDHRRFDEDLGGLDGFLELSEALKGAGLGLILDIVPNHMAASVQNPWWADVLRHGRDSRYAGHFDIDWDAPSLVVPVLGKPYGDALEAGELTLGRDAEGYVLRYYEHVYPLSPATATVIAEAAGTDLAHPPDEAALERLSQDRDLIHRIHEAQPYRLAYWRLARDGLTNRRFFEISDLVGVRVEEPNVFDDVHRFLFEMIEAGHVDGVRVDHVDGLADPTGYLDRLARELPRPVPIWVEKILARGERLPEPWPVAGTTGYEFADLVASVVTDPRGVPTLSEGYDAFAGVEHDYEAMRVEAKREILRQNLAAELDMLTGLAETALADDPSGRDWGRDSLRKALMGILIALPVYRTYLGDGPPSASDRAILARLREEAPRHAELDDAGPIDSVLDHLTDATSEADRRLRTRLQQTSGALMAKAVEDTLFYRYNRLISANEVGGEPDHPSQPPDAFHDYMRRHGGTSLNATATHDTKRGEDARMRVAAIAELPDAWLGAVAAFDRELAPEGEAPVDAEARWLFYQALLGGWQQPADDVLRERAKTYMQKAVREAKRQTSWLGPDEAYEAGLMAFVDAAFASARFLGIFDDLTAPFVETGRRKSMAQLALKLMAPGIPDIYQGTESFDLSFVDPDNRRPVDFAGLRQPPDRDDAPHGTRLKVPLMRFGLGLRREMPDLFGPGTYRPVEMPEDERLLAFMREGEARRLLVLADLSGRRREPELPEAIPSARPRTSFPAGIDGRNAIAAALGEVSIFIGLYDAA